MAIAFIQEADNGSGTTSSSTSVTITSSTFGSLLVVAVYKNNGTTISSITDNIGNTYTQVPGAHAVGSPAPDTTDIWYSANSLSGVTSVTVNFGSTCFNVPYILEYSGVATTSPIDVAGNISAGSTGGGNPTGPSLTTTQDGDLIIALCSAHGIGIGGVNSPFTLRSNTDGEAVADYIGPVAGTYQAIFTPTGPSQLCSSGVAFTVVPAPTTSTSSMFLVF